MGLGPETDGLFGDLLKLRKDSFFHVVGNFAIGSVTFDLAEVAFFSKVDKASKKAFLSVLKCIVTEYSQAYQNSFTCFV